MFNGILHGDSMFERRVRIVLIALVSITAALLLRAGQVQIAQSEAWQLVADDAMQRTRHTRTERGTIFDRKGRPIAQDIACNDATVDYRLITYPPHKRLIYELSRDFARETPGYLDLTSKEQLALVEASEERAYEEIETFWNELARIGEVPREELEETRATIIGKVTMLRKDVVELRYEAAMKEYDAEGESSWWKQWLLGEGTEAPKLEDFGKEPIADELQQHIVLHNIDAEKYNALRKLNSDLPPTLKRALDVRAGLRRHYPENSVAAHVVGIVTKVDEDDLANDPFRGVIPQKRYFPSDLIGGGGLEAIAEADLRGQRGQLVLDLETSEETARFDALRGKDVNSTIDIALSRDIREAFDHVDYRWYANGPNDNDPDRFITEPALGAAVVIDVKTGGILAMVSAPDFDPNRYNEDYKKLERMVLERPFLNRATQYKTVPGSTVKPLVGISAITAGYLDPHETIECNGYLTVSDGTTFHSYFRCWTASMFGDAYAHHRTGRDPHPTRGLNPVDPEAGFLTYADALQRSCNVFFETLGDRMGANELGEWMTKFGLGSRLGIGLAESPGMIPTIPEDMTAKQDIDRTSWLAGIGQGRVEATPLQMANVAATLARGGVFIRPTLLQSEIEQRVNDKVDLQLDPAGLDMMHRGMNAVVHTAGGSSHVDSWLPLKIAGKTGSAQAPELSVPQFDENGDLVVDEKGKAIYIKPALSLRDKPNPDALWYRQTKHPDKKGPKASHAWFIGYAPQENPTVAFAFFVEYGASGGYSAASVAAQTVQALVHHGYLEATREPDQDSKVPLNKYGEPTRYLVE